MRIKGHGRNRRGGYRKRYAPGHCARRDRVDTPYSPAAASRDMNALKIMRQKTKIVPATRLGPVAKRVALDKAKRMAPFSLAVTFSRRPERPT